MTPDIKPGETVLAIDPGPVDCGVCLLGADKTIHFARCGVPVQEAIDLAAGGEYDHLVLEMVQCYGTMVGAFTFETALVLGRIFEAAHERPTFITRPTVKSVITGLANTKGKDVRQALIECFGPVGTSKKKGPTYGITADAWAALALAETFRRGGFEPYVLQHLSAK